MPPPSDDPANDSAPAAPVPGRSRHVVDRALEYAALADRGWSAALIGRRRRRSKGYVSILLRLGRALRGLTPDEVAAFRHPRITWKLAQRVVRAGGDAGADDAVVRQQLRYALGGFSSHNIDRRRYRGRRAGVGGGAAPVGGAGADEAAGDPRRDADAAAGELAPAPGTFVWRWDAARAARDPVAYLESYRAHLRTLHATVAAGLRQAVRDRAGPPPLPLAGQSLRQLAQSAAAHRRGASASSSAGTVTDPTDRAVLAALAELDRLLAP